MATIGSELLRRRKTVDEAVRTTEEHEHKLRKDVGAWDVTLIGIGVMIGAGIFVLTGVAAATKAGPAITVSFIVAAVVCAFAAFCYAELASMVPVAGSAYTFSYVTLGEFIAFVIGWDLILEFTVGAAAVSVGFAGYLNALLDQIFGVTLPDAITAPPGDGGTVNVFAIALVALVVFALVRGIRFTARFNTALVGITVAVLLLVILVGTPSIDSGNWSPFTPFGWDGVISGAALVFFAFIGFDIVATTAEETRNPARDMPIGILASLGVTAILYFAVAAVLTGLVVYTKLDSEAPIADAFEALDRPWAAAFVFAGALVATTNTVMILMLGQSRVAFSMARDRLFPRPLARTHERYGTPHTITIVTGVVVALLAGFVPIVDLAELVNIGTLFAFALVAAGVWLLRSADPDRPRPFRVPWVPVFPIITIGLCIWLMTSLAGTTWFRFFVWMAIGLVVYFLWSRRRSAIGERREREPGPETTG